MLGSCLCKGIKYEVRALAGPIVHCHCTTCRKAHAAAFASTARVHREDFLIVSGQHQLKKCESSLGKFRYFCQNCGTHIYAELLNQPQIILRVATLDDSPEKYPAASIWVSHAVPWLNYGPDVQCFAEVPNLVKDF